MNAVVVVRCLYFTAVNFLLPCGLMGGLAPQPLINSAGEVKKSTECSVHHPDDDALIYLFFVRMASHDVNTDRNYIFFR